MPFSQIHIFENEGKTWRIYADFVNQLIETVNDPPPQEIGPTVDDTILGFNSGDQITSACGSNPGVDTTTLYIIRASYEYPYAYFEVVPNSPLCGFVPTPGCDIPNTITTTNSINGANNGSATVTINAAPSPFIKYRYSLDNGATWQSSANFTSLFPGSYTMQIQSYTQRNYGGGCSVYVNFVIENTVVPVPRPIIDIPYKDGRNLCWFFKLVIDGNDVDIAEPIGWDAVEISGERDMEFHGWTFQFSDGDFPLKFDCDSGAQQIKDVYNEFGADGNIGFKYGFMYEGEEYILLDAELLLHTYKKDGDRVECTINSKQFDAVFLSRIDTPVSMKETVGYDGADIVPPDPYNMELHAKEILTQFKADNPNKNYSDNTQIEGTNWWVLPDCSGPEKNDISQTNPFTLLSTPASPIPDQWNIKFDVAGTTTISFAWNVTLHLRVRNANILSSKTADIRVLYIYRKKNADGSYTQTNEVISNYEIISCPPLSTVDRFVNLIATKTISSFQFNEGDEVYFHAYIEFNDTVKVQFPEITQTSLTFNVEHFEIAKPSVANVWFIDDAFRHIINVISNKKYAFRSTFLERANFQNVTPGQGSRRALTNGFQIRNFNIDDRPLKADFKKLLSSNNAQNCIGCDYAIDENGAARVRVERRDFFYQENQIIYISEDIESYDEQVANEFLYNELIFGYNKFLESGFNSLDEPNTLHNLLSPIKKNPKKFEQKADVITSGYSIEDTRRQQFAETPSDSYDNDDETFMFAIREDGADWVPEKNEPFAVVNNIISPETSYNLRLNVKRMVYNWFIWLKGVFAYKQDTDIIKVTSFKQNGDLQTQFDLSETDLIGDINRDLMTEKENIELSALSDTRDIWRPEWVNVVCRLSPDKVQLINAAMNGLSDSTKNYGYILVKNPHTQLLQAGWIYNMKYNYSKEKLTFKMLKKYSSPSEPIVDCCPWLVVNGCYIKVNGNRIIL